MKRTLWMLVMRCKKCGAFIGNGGWCPFGTCKKCGEQW